MDPKHAGEILKHLEKQNELLWDSYRSMSHELQRLQVEEEMLMHKFYEIKVAEDLTKKNEDHTDVPDRGNIEQDGVLVNVTTKDQEL